MFRKIAQLWRSYDVFGRIFWAVTIIISLYGMTTFSYYTLSRHYNEPVSMTIDTDYVLWNLQFPAISICLAKGKSSTPLQKYIKSLNVSYSGSDTYFMRSIHMCMFASANQVDISLAWCEELRRDYGIDVEDLKEQFLPKDCNVFMENLKYSGESFKNCTDIFKFHKTEVGICFIANSIVDYGLSFKKLKLQYALTSANRRISMRLKVFKLWQYVFHALSPEDIPYFNSISNEIFLTETLYSFVVTTITTDLAAAEQSVQERGCRFPRETLHGSPFHYSFLRIQLELEECNCTFSTSPEIYSPFYCNSTGITCLSTGNINNKARNLAVKNSVCLPSCIEQIISYAGQSEMSFEVNSSYTNVSVEVVDFPALRYVRTVAQTNMDLAVSIAGIAGLFFGVSVLNCIEVIYFLMIKRDM